jgi:hypothetical protein
VKREGRIKRYCIGWEAKVDNVDETKLQINITKKYKLDETLFMAEIDGLNYSTWKNLYFIKSISWVKLHIA